MSYRLVDANELALVIPEVNMMPCIYADLPNGMDGKHYVLEQEPCEDAVSRADVDILIEEAHTAWLRGDIMLMYPALKKGLQKVPPVTPKQPGWIPVTERLPEKYDNYLLTTKDEDTDIGTF